MECYLSLHKDNFNDFLRFGVNFAIGLAVFVNYFEQFVPMSQLECASMCGYSVGSASVFLVRYCSYISNTVFTQTHEDI